MPVVQWLIKNVLARSANRSVNAFMKATSNLRETQQEWLLTQLRQHENTLFGEEHGFSTIRSIEEFQQQVPVSNYEYFEPYIEKVKQGETEALFSNEQVEMFALTSGTTQAQKFIPVTKDYVNEYRKGWMIWGAAAFRDHPRLLPKKKLVFASDFDEFRTEADIPCGSISGLTTTMQSPLVRRTYVLPPECSKIHDVETKYYLAWRLGLLQDLGVWISPNPSTHLNLARFGEDHGEQLVKEIFQGELSDRYEIPPQVRKAVKKHLKPQKSRGHQLDSLLEKEGALLPKDVWPNLGLIGCWLGGSLGVYVRHFPRYFGEIAVRDIGLIASESRMTIPIEDHTSAGILEVSIGFYEFIPVEEIESVSPTVLQAHELQEGKEYYIILTTSSGLYRYNIFDVVCCVGWFGETPMLEFRHKGSHISNITGEKLSEYQVVQAIETMVKQHNLPLGTYSLAPCWSDNLPYYGLFIEQPRGVTENQLSEFVMRLDLQLSQENLEYEAKRNSNRLAPVRFQLLPAGFWSAWDKQRLQNCGGTAEQYKHPALITDLDFHQTLKAASVPIPTS